MNRNYKLTMLYHVPMYIYLSILYARMDPFTYMYLLLTLFKSNVDCEYYIKPLCLMDNFIKAYILMSKMPLTIATTQYSDQKVQQRSKSTISQTLVIIVQQKFKNTSEFKNKLYTIILSPFR